MTCSSSSRARWNARTSPMASPVLSSSYGENRFTNDIDVVVELEPRQLRDLLAEFPADHFYVSEDGGKHAVVHGGQFNIIHQASSQKVDVIVPRDPNWPDQLARRIRLPIEGGHNVWFVSPEDLILKKMDFYREGGSDKHLRDIAGILKISGEQVDQSYVSDWAQKLGLDDIWNLILQRLGR